MTDRETTAASDHAPLKPEQLRWRADPGFYSFESTAELEPLDGIIGQRRALEAITLGAEIHSPGYNIFVNGLTGTGRMTTIKSILQSLTKEDVILYDYGYVHNFADPDRPRLLKLPRGRICKLREEMADAVEYLRARISKLFEDPQFREGRKRIIDTFREREKAMLEEFETEIKPQGFILGQRRSDSQSTQPEILPLINEKPYSIEEVDELVKEGELSVEEARDIADRFKSLQSDLFELVKRGRQLSQEYHRRLVGYERDAATMLVEATIEEVASKYPYESVESWLEGVEEDILENLDLFKRQQDGEEEEKSDTEDISIDDPFHIYDINILLDNKSQESAPVIIESTPTFVNLFGTVERVKDSRDKWVSDFSLIKEGSLLQADGGYLILNALDVISESGVWKNLKRVLLHRELRIQPLESMYQLSWQSATAMKPEEITLNVKVVMVGNPQLYQLLYHHDEDFHKIFKINAQFDYEIDRNEDLLNSYARYIRKIASEEHLLQFDPTGVATLTEYAVEHSTGSGKITLVMSDIADLMREASYWATKEDSDVVKGEHVKHAFEAMVDRNSMWKEKVMERIREGTLLVDTEGRRVGQINGLAVYDLGQVSFGKPTRITATVAVGRHGIVAIEREARLSGSIYNKAAMVLTGFFRNRFAQERPLSFTSSIVFEQSYGGIEGDSASSTEVYALLSAMSRVPLRQDLAVTGSVNQWGEIQPIGGVNEKIEGFYDVCRDRGLTGTQGVLIPTQNVKDLMLRTDVVDAVQDGEFAVYAVDTIDQGIEIMTGVAAGERDQDGHYPKGTINYMVESRLIDLAEKLRENMPVVDTGEAGITTAEITEGR